jgi:hypothetical protein
MHFKRFLMIRIKFDWFHPIFGLIVNIEMFKIFLNSLSEKNIWWQIALHYTNKQKYRSKCSSKYGDPEEARL